MTYLTTFWRQVAMDRELAPEFAKHLRDIARPTQITYARLMKEFGGNPVGVELRATSREQWAVILPEPVPVGGHPVWRLLTFDRTGFLGHHLHKCPNLALEDAINCGFRSSDVGVLDRLQSEPEWVKGMKQQALRDMHARGDISYEVLVNRVAALG